jgi:Family of unknown function (DUF6159)
MFERMRRGWGIAKASWSVLKLHPKLLVFPIISGLSLIALVGAIGISMYLERSHMAALMEFLKKDNPHDPIVYAVAFVFYFVCSFIVIFFNAALVFCAMQAFAGTTPSLRAGLSTAAGRLPQILGWTLVAATVGLLLNALQNTLRDRLGFLGTLLGGLLEFGWAVATFFVIPVVVVDGLGPIAAVKRSAAILKRTWGESLGGEGGLGIIAFAASVPAIALLALVGAIAGKGAGVAIIVIAVFYLIALSIVFATLGAIFRTGAYIYATTGEAPSSMDPKLLQASFRKKD